MASKSQKLTKQCLTNLAAEGCECMCGGGASQSKSVIVCHIAVTTVIINDLMTCLGTLLYNSQ